MNTRLAALLSSLSVPVGLTVWYGTSPYAAGAVGYNLALPLRGAGAIAEASGLTEGLRFGLGFEDFFALVGRLRDRMVHR